MNGHLGTGDTTDLPTPPADALDLGTGRTAKAITATLFHTCVLTDDDRVKCWGAGGLLANGTSDDVGSAPGQMGDNLAYAKLGTDPSTMAPWKVKKVIASNEHACAIVANDRIKCWGSGSINNPNDGVLGNGATEVSYGDTMANIDDAIPFVDVGTDGAGKPWSVTDIASGEFHTCVDIPKNGGTTVCWGSNDRGILGLGNTTAGVGGAPNQMGNNLVPVGLKPGRVPTGLWASYGATCARVDTTVLDCWGYNNLGLIGAGLPDIAPTDNLGDDPNEIGAGFAETFLK